MRYAMDVKVNVKPVYAAIVHTDIWEGPCRTGPMETLDPVYERRSSKEKMKKWIEMLKNNLCSAANLLEPTYIEMDETFAVPQDKMEELKSEIAEIDLFLVEYRVPGLDRLGKPVSMINPSCTGIDVIAFYNAMGLEGYLAFDLDEYNDILKRLQVKKAIQNTRILVLSAGEQIPFAVNSCCTDMRHLTERYGIQNTRLPFLNIENFLEEDDVEEEAKALVEKAEFSNIDVCNVKNDFRYFHAVRRMMEHYHCNAFTTACKEFCASRVPAKHRFVPCLAHSLNRDQRIPSSCEEDINVLLANMVLMYYTKKSVFMGNPALIAAGTKTYEFLKIPSDTPEAVYDEMDLLEVTHAVPALKLDGYDQPDMKYHLGAFTGEGWGTKIQVDMSDHDTKTVTLARFDKSGNRMIAATGNIVGCRFNQYGCSPTVFYKIKGGARAFCHRLAEGGYGHHLSVVYGDYAQELIELGKTVGFQTEAFG